MTDRDDGAEAGAGAGHYPYLSSSPPRLTFLSFTKTRTKVQFSCDFPFPRGRIPEVVEHRNEWHAKCENTSNVPRHLSLFTPLFSHHTTFPFHSCRSRNREREKKSRKREKKDKKVPSFRDGVGNGDGEGILS